MQKLRKLLRGRKTQPIFKELVFKFVSYDLCNPAT